MLGKPSRLNQEKSYVGGMRVFLKVKRRGTMRTWAKSFLIMVCIGGWLGATGQSVLAYDFSDWDALVKKYVAPKTIAEVQLNAVKYQALAKDPLYPKLIHDLEGASLSTMKTREQTLAFWINVYNIMAVKMVVDHYPVDSI